MLANSTKSVYDFHDGSDREDDYMPLSIDENPKKSKRQNQNTSGSLKMRIPGNCCITLLNAVVVFEEKQ